MIRKAKRTNANIIVSVLLWICLILKTVATTAANPIPLESLPSVTNASLSTDIITLASSSIAGDDTPSAFSVQPVFKGPPLLPVSCLLNAVYAALQLAYGDYEGTFAERAIFNIVSHPQVEIIILPFSKDGVASMPWKYAVWALHMSVVYMLKIDKFRSGIFCIIDDGVGVGAVQFKTSSIAPPNVGYADSNSSNVTTIYTGPEDLLASSLSASASALMNSNTLQVPSNETVQLNTTSRMTSTTLLTNNTTTLTLIFELVGSEVGFTRICYTALDFLRSISNHPRNSRELPGTTHIRSANMYVTFRDPNTPPRDESNPPFMEAQCLMQALAQLPGYMYRLQTYREAVIEVRVGDVVLGVVSVTRKRPNSGGSVTTY